MNEHFGGEINPPARGVGAARGGNNLMNQTLNDEDYKRALLESMKDAKPGDIQTEDELVAKAIEESFK